MVHQPFTSQVTVARSFPEIFAVLLFFLTCLSCYHLAAINGFVSHRDWLWVYLFCISPCTYTYYHFFRYKVPGDCYRRRGMRRFLPDTTEERKLLSRYPPTIKIPNFIFLYHNGARGITPLSCLSKLLMSLSSAHHGRNSYSTF